MHLIFVQRNLKPNVSKFCFRVGLGQIKYVLLNGIFVLLLIFSIVAYQKWPLPETILCPRLHEHIADYQIKHRHCKLHDS